MERPDSWRPLGDLLVERGLVTADELAGALDEQARTGRRLGTVLITRGIVSEPELTSALVEQIGIAGLLGELELAAAEVDGRAGRRTLRSRLRRRGDERSARPAPFPEPPEEEPEPDRRRAGPRPPLAWLTSMRRSLDDAEAEAKRLTRKLAEAANALAGERARGDELDALLGRERERREEAEREAEALRGTLSELADQLARAEARAAELAGRIADTTAELEVERRARRHAELERARARAELEAHDAEAGRLGLQLQRLLAGARSVPAAPEPGRSPSTFLVLVPRVDLTHELVEQPGPAPAVGDELLVGERRFVVERVGRSPFPLDRRPCLQLRALT